MSLCSTSDLQCFGSLYTTLACINVRNDWTGGSEGFWKDRKEVEEVDEQKKDEIVRTRRGRQS